MSVRTTKKARNRDPYTRPPGKHRNSFVPMDDSDSEDDEGITTGCT